MPTPPTLRSLARQLGLSVATVSEALRDSPRVRQTTRARVRARAEFEGYQPSVLVGATMSALRRQRHHGFRGTLALIEIEDDDPRHYIAFHRAIATGAETRARELGFIVEPFWLGVPPPALPAPRLRAVLQARGISGAVLLPFSREQNLERFDFSALAAVQMDHSVSQPRLHAVLPDHYLSLTLGLERLAARGYRRFGLYLDRRRDERIKRKWSAAFHAYCRRTNDAPEIPICFTDRPSRAEFEPWYREYQPDVVLGHEPQIIGWLRAMRVRVPEDTGFFHLNLASATVPCAGLDLVPQHLGAVAVETVIAMLHRGECGVPARPQSIAIEAAWVEGPTLQRAQ
jgi:LacI family transcriptional regulator